MDNLLIVLDPDNKKHLYEQIYDHIKKKSEKGSCAMENGFPPLVYWHSSFRFQDQP